MKPASAGPTTTKVDVEALRADLEVSGYTVDGVAESVGAVASAALRREQAVPAALALRGRPEPAAVLARLFLLGEPVRRADLDGALPRLRTDGAVRCGLARAAGEDPADEVRAVVDLSPHAADDAHWWLASDLGEVATGEPLGEDHVLGVGGASATLAQVTIRRPVARALDLGTGCGIQALHATRHAGAVVATDLSARALAFARFNAALAGVEVDLRRGNMLEPVAGETFDLVVSNPPFVITPRRPGAVGHYTYRDGGRAGDHLVRDLVRSVGSVLAPGGIAQFLGNWEHRRGEGWRERVETWLAASGLDGWVIQRDVSDPAEYAETWLRDGGLTPDRSPSAWRAGYEAWLADFADRGVEAVGFGYVLLRRPVEGPATLRRMEELAGAVRRPLGPHLAAALAAHDWLGARDDAAVAAERLVVAPDVTEERHYRPGQADPEVVLLRQGGGLGRAVRADTALAGFVGACDGELTVGQIVGALAALLGVASSDLAAQVFPACRELVGSGFLTP